MEGFDYILKIFVLAICLGSTNSKKQCYSDIKHPYNLFASKTSYDVIADASAEEIVHKGCEPMQLYLLSRHGTRYPDKDDIDKLEDRLPQIKSRILSKAVQNKGKLCGKDIQSFENWNLKLPSFIDENLAPAGETELQGIGRRLKTRFPSLFNETISNENYNVMFTNTERTNTSARNFLIGMFGKDSENIPFSSENVDDSLLRFYKKCKKWKETVNKNPEALIEVADFNLGPKMEDVLEDVSERVGLKRELTEEDIQLMYNMCRYETAWNGSSPWCSVFKPDELRILEYSEDLKYYYKHGYAYRINYEQACPPVKEMLTHFRAITSGENSLPKGLFRFSHSGMMLKVYTRLGLFRDNVPLTSRNYKHMKDRKWRTSYMDAFASNIAFVLLKCNDSYKVSALSQEREIQLPGCSNMPCSYEQFLESYGNIADTCNVTGVCEV